jgi:hypothetical protein
MSSETDELAAFQCQKFSAIENCFVFKKVVHQFALIVDCQDWYSLFQS